MIKIAVIGGGVAGLSTAWHLKKGFMERRAKCHIRIYDAAATLGGCLRSHRLHGIEFDLGAEGIPLNDQLTRNLFARLGLAVRSASSLPFLLQDGEGTLRRVAPGVLAPFPLNVLPLWRTRNLPLSVRIEAMWRSALLSSISCSYDNAAMLLDHRFGCRFSAQVAKPLYHALYGAPPQSLPAALLVGRYRGLSSPRGGMAELVRALVTQSEAEVSLNREIDSLQCSAQSVRIEGRDFDQVAVCVPAASAHKILSRVAPTLSEELRRVPQRKLTSVLAEIKMTEMPRITGAIFRLGSPLRALSFPSLKWGQRLPPHAPLPLRIFLGGEVMQEAEIEQAVGSALSDLGFALQEYRTVQKAEWVVPVPHAAATAEAQRMNASTGLSFEGRIHVSRAVQDGWGVSRCIAHGKECAERVINASRVSNAEQGRRL
jgi:protoporphyrinogen oxidase